MTHPPDPYRFRDALDHVETCRDLACPCYRGGPCSGHHSAPPIHEEQDPAEDEARRWEHELSRGDVTRRDP